jgi:hypothetical protein
MTSAAASAPVAPERPARPALRIVVRPAPRREPPFDDELPDAPVITALDRRWPFALTADERAAAVGPQRLSGVPDPGRWGRRLLVGLIETADGRRPLHQLSSLLTFSVTRGLGADFERAAQTGRPHWLHRASIRSVRASEPAEGVAELCATVETGRRVRAVAMRLEENQGRWRCTRLQLG